LFPIHLVLRLVFIAGLLFVFGDRDNLVGDPQKATALVQDIPDVRVEVVNAGHLMGAELSAQVNESILAFFTQD